MSATYQRYRVMSYVTGTTLIILFITLLLHAVDLTFWKHIYWFVKVVGVGHGIVLYPIYLIMCFNVVLRYRLNLGYLFFMLFAGFVPGLAFYLEYRTRRKLFPDGLPAT